MNLTVEDVSEILQVSEQYVRRLMKSGRIESVKKGTSYITNKKCINTFIDKEKFVINPSDKIRSEDTIPEIVALSFFSGGMGLDIGMKNAGIHPLLACEINKEARATIVENNHEIGLLGDISTLSEEAIRKFANIPMNRKIDVVFGGPPCQAFSTAGNRKGFEDARGDVFNNYLELIGKLNPTYAIIENVRGLQSTKAILKEISSEPVKGGVLHFVTKKLESYGYSVSFELYNSANFGAPQKRERFVIIAKKGTEKVPYLNPTHSEHGEYNLPRWRTLFDAIGDIQDINMEYVEIPQKRIDWYKKIPEGGNWKSLTEPEQKEAMGKKFYMGGGKTGFFRRLSYDKPSPTLVTNPIMPATDLIHPTELRPLSVQEYARIQGFPDDWIIKGSILEQYKQLGNAVPVKLAEAIGRTILNDINGHIDLTNNTFKYSKYKYTSDKTFPQLFEKNIKKLSCSKLKGDNKLEQISLPL